MSPGAKTVRTCAERKMSTFQRARVNGGSASAEPGGACRPQGTRLKWRAIEPIGDLECVDVSAPIRFVVLAALMLLACVRPATCPCQCPSPNEQVATTEGPPANPVPCVPPQPATRASWSNPECSRQTSASEGAFSVRSAQDALVAVTSAAARCAPKARGYVQVEWSPQGCVTNASLKADDVSGPEDLECIRAAFLAARMKPFSGNPVWVSKKLRPAIHE